MIRKNHILYNIKPNLINIYYIKKILLKYVFSKVNLYISSILFKHPFQLIEKQAELIPNKLDIICEDKNISQKDLHNDSKVLSTLIQQSVRGRNQCIAIIMRKEKSIDPINKKIIRNTKTAAIKMRRKLLGQNH